MEFGVWETQFCVQTVGGPAKRATLSAKMGAISVRSVQKTLSSSNKMRVLESLPAEPLHGDVILSLNDSEADMAVMPVSYYEEIHIYSMVIMTDDYASVVGFDGDEWVELTRTTPDSDEEFDPEGVIDEWMQETHPELYEDPEFEVTSEDYDLEEEGI